MNSKHLFAVFLCVFCLCACNRPASDSKLYNPAAEPLTTDELASLLNVYHWKIARTPNDGKPYWGVRLVLANHGSTLQPLNPTPPPYKMLGTPALLRFDPPLPSDGDPRILLGLKIDDENITGKMSATRSDGVTDTTQFKFERFWSKDAHGGSVRTCSGTVWGENRVDIIDVRDADDRPIGAVCLEFLHAAPR